VINDFGSPKKILITPLNWGLGHATRCIPIIRQLLDAGHDVHIGSDGGALQLLKDEFPALPSVKLCSYNINYAARHLLLGLVFQWYKVFLAILTEHQQVRHYIKVHQIDIIISDNRLGCFSRHTRNYIISHQLTLLTPLWIWTKIATLANHFWIRRFDECWVPDSPPPDNLTGVMSSARRLPHVRYIGPLSRFRSMELPIERDCVVILSGPEPRRTGLERKILKQWATLPYSMLLVRGIPDLEIALPELPTNVTSVSYLTAEALNRAICSSKFVLSRTGYTTVMDMIVLRKPCILIPTPGQSEQEYLGKRLSSYPGFVIAEEGSLDLSLAIHQVLMREK
jgi:UDP:flavonoid glycosyltransferase YjiC (YdhE family)